MEPKGSIFLWGKTSVERREKSSFEVRDRAGKEKVDGFDQLAKIVSRISYLVSRISYLVSRISYLVSRISYLVSRISYLVSRISYLVSRILPPNKNGAPRDAVFFDSNESYFFIASFALSRTFAKIPFSTLGLADTMLPVCM